MSSASQVRLIPWDPDSKEHIDRLIAQREDCGWDSEKVDTLWRNRQRLGTKCIFWITIPTDDSESRFRPEKLAMETALLQDTSGSIRGTSRTPTKESFYPAGHISLDPENPGTEVFDLDVPKKDIYWIKTFFVLRDLHSKGIGRAAMDTVESMAVEAPLCARTLALDTVQKDNAIALEISRRGQPPKSTAHGWYERRHYQLIHTVEDFYAPGITTVFMKKTIT
ncbi:hypothetical protein B0J13DRAFT_185425 [Dactylonectria estremocensis]|uniref:N-acetyltransferase domain-containing protein n=1 Tax=Dactylonectria estremocensis TaxID=1079267 RepID=A0A9P9F9W6_9HYPO|nr:hypothetical protein B0J13DRAFT_185425 [Dactylonectria estremocensis]